MNNQLTIHHLSRRLPYGVKMIFEKSGDIRELTGLSIENSELRFHFGVINRGEILWKYKQILRNLNSLTKPITHKGETFVPDEEIRKIIGFGWCNAYEDALELIINREIRDKIKMLPYEFIEILLSWHFRIDEPEGTFIYAESLDVNPYEV